MSLDMTMEATADADLEALVDTGTGRERTSPLRRCLVSRESLPKSQLIRFAADPDGKVLPDIDGKLPGHGFWVQAERKALEHACRRNLFAKAAKQSLTVPADTLDLVESLLRRRCLDLIGLARRAGAAVAGFEKCRAWLQSGRAGLPLDSSWQLLIRGECRRRADPAGDAGRPTGWRQPAPIARTRSADLPCGILSLPCRESTAGQKAAPRPIARRCRRHSSAAGAQ
jgi:predicted RNA-binding protein YlxR (DUF448 family)